MRRRLTLPLANFRIHTTVQQVTRFTCELRQLHLEISTQVVHGSTIEHPSDSSLRLSLEVQGKGFIKQLEHGLPRRGIATTEESTS